MSNYLITTANVSCNFCINISEILEILFSEKLMILGKFSKATYFNKLFSLLIFWWLLKL